MAVNPKEPKPQRVPLDRVLAWVEASCVEQGIESKVTNETMIFEIAPLFGAGADDAAAIASRRA